MIWYRRLLWFATGLTLLVVVLGAYVRLSDAGLGCPDWPGCYGELIPTGIEDGDQRGDEFPTRPVVETDKAWKEMIHRYAASTLGFSIILIALLAWRNRNQPGQPVALPLVTLGVVIFQGLLGMWTVTLLLKPIIVMGHLLGGLTTLALLFWLLLDDARRARLTNIASRLPWPAAFAFVIVVCQIALGGWTSSNYAIWGCPEVPTCNGQWWPENADFNEGFIMWRGIGIDYEFGVLEAPARVAIAFVHRLGAVTTTAVLLVVTAYYWSRYPGNRPLRTACAAVLAALAMQVTIGVSIFLVDGHLPVAAAHNGVAALLLMTMINLNHLAARA